MGLGPLMGLKQMTLQYMEMDTVDQPLILMNKEILLVLVLPEILARLNVMNLSLVLGLKLVTMILMMSLALQ